MSIHSSVRISRLRSKCDTVWELKFKRVVFFEIIDRDRIVCVVFLSFFLTHVVFVNIYSPLLCYLRQVFPSDGVFFLLLKESK